MLSVFITPCTNPTSIHRATSDACAATTASKRASAGFSRAGRLGVVPRDGVVDEPPQQGGVAGGAGELEAADPQVAARHPRQQAPGQHGLALDRAARADHGQRAGGRDAEGVHALAHDVLAQHRADRGQAVAAAGERRASRALEVQVAHAAVGQPELAQQEGASVTEARGVAAELVTGVRLRHRPGALGDRAADEQLHALGAAEVRRVEAQLDRQRLVQHQQLGRRHRRGLPLDRHLGQRGGEAVLQDEGGGRCEAHAHEPTSPTAGPEGRTGIIAAWAPPTTSCATPWPCTSAPRPTR